MLLTEWNMEDAKQVWFKEGKEEGIEEGLEKGMEKGMEKGIEKTARNALAKGVSIELVHEITGLDVGTLRDIQNSCL